MQIVASTWIVNKIQQSHAVSIDEVEEALYFHNGPLLIDNRPEHRSAPPTVWFISETSEGRTLKVVIKYDREAGSAYLRTAYEPSESEMNHYEANC